MEILPQGHGAYLVKVEPYAEVGPFTEALQARLLDSYQSEGMEVAFEVSGQSGRRLLQVFGVDKTLISAYKICPWGPYDSSCCFYVVKVEKGTNRISDLLG